MIVLSVTVLWISTYSFSRYQVLEMRNQILNDSSFQVDNKVTSFRIVDYKVYPILTALDYVTVCWFMFDLFVRFFAAPSKREYMHNTDNIFDIVATFWLLVDLNILRLFFDSFILESIQVRDHLFIIEILDTFSIICDYLSFELLN